MYLRSPSTNAGPPRFVTHTRLHTLPRDAGGGPAGVGDSIRSEALSPGLATREMPGSRWCAGRVSGMDRSIRGTRGDPQGGLTGPGPVPTVTRRRGLPALEAEVRASFGQTGPGSSKSRVEDRGRVNTGGRPAHGSTRSSKPARLTPSGTRRVKRRAARPRRVRARRPRGDRRGIAPGACAPGGAASAARWPHHMQRTRRTMWCSRGSCG